MICRDPEVAPEVEDLAAAHAEEASAEVADLETEEASMEVREDRAFTADLVLDRDLAMVMALVRVFTAAEGDASEGC